MAKPHKCPICLGKGEIGPQKAKHDAVPVKVISEGNGRTKRIFTCHGCYGNGVLWDYTEIGNPTPIISPPYIPPYQPWASTDPKITWTNSNCNVEFELPDIVGVMDAAKGGVECSCSPHGQPHSEDCKGWWPHN